MAQISFSPKTAFFVGAIVSFVGCILLYWVVNNLEDASATDASSVFKEQKIEEVLKEIGKVISLPEKETPQVATISDVSKLQGQLFFIGAQNGDTVLIYNTAQKAVLYRPATKKVINYSSITIPQQPEATQSASLSPTPDSKNQKITITPTKDTSKAIQAVILNGTKEAGLAKKAQDLLKSDNFEVVTLGNTKADYKVSSISTISKDKKITNSDLQKMVVKVTKTKIVPQAYPKGETSFSDADVVIILGEDFGKAY